MPARGGGSAEATDEGSGVLHRACVLAGRQERAGSARESLTIVCVRDLRSIRAERLTSFVCRASGGDAQLIARALTARFLDFGREPNLIRIFTPEGVKSVADRRAFVGAATVVVVILSRHASQYVDGPAPVEEVRLSPDGQWALAKAASQLYLVAVPPALGEDPPVVNLQSPSTKGGEAHGGRRGLFRLGGSGSHHHLVGGFVVPPCSVEQRYGC